MKLPPFFGKQKRRKLLVVRRIVGESMQPTLQPKTIVLATGLFRSIQPEQVVVFYHEGLEKIKRVQKVRRAALFVVGDNESHSLDSRSFGWIALESVVARVIWPRR